MTALCFGSPGKPIFADWLPDRPAAQLLVAHDSNDMLLIQHSFGAATVAQHGR